MSTSVLSTATHDLAGARWSDNVKPVDARTQRRVIDTFHQEQRCRPAKLKPSRHDVKTLSGTALYILQLFAEGLSTGAVAEACGVDRMQIVRFRKWVAEIHGVDVTTMRMSVDPTLDGLKMCVVSGTFQRASRAPAMPPAVSAGEHRRLPRIDKEEVLAMSERVVRILSRVAAGVPDAHNAAQEGLREEAVGHVLRVLCTRKSEIESIRDKSLENVRRLMLVVAGGLR